MAFHFSLLLGAAALITSTAVVDDRQRFVRKEEQQAKAFVGAGGELVDARRHVHADDESGGNAEDAKLDEKDMCGESYVYGFSSTSDCGDAKCIERELMCSDAAKKLGRPRGRPPHFNFVVDPTYFEVYPRGCFRKYDDSPVWFNPYGTLPKKPYLGTPVCHRPKYKTGANGTNAGGCDEDYQKIMDQEDCRTYAECTSHCVQEQFTVGEQADPCPASIPKALGVNCSNAGWYLGGVGQSCSDVCSEIPGLTCSLKSLEKMESMNSRETLTAVHDNCTVFAGSSSAEAPFKISGEGTCRFTGGTPTCDASAATLGHNHTHNRICFCDWANDERPADAKPDFYDKRPKGCFIHPTDKCVYFNVPRNYDPAGPIEGTPVCQAKHGETVN